MFFILVALHSYYNEFLMLLVLDLDFMLWDAGGTWCDQTIPPFKKIDSNIEVGSLGVILFRLFFF